MHVKNTILFMIIGLALISCQMTGNDFSSGKAQRVGSVASRESDIIDAVDSVISDEEERANNIEREQTQNAMRELTNDFSTFPSSDAVNDYINSSLSIPLGMCPMSEESKDLMYGEGVLGRGSLGARRVLATIYQSCSAIDKIMDEDTPRLKGVSTRHATLSDGTNFKQRVIRNRTAMVNSHIVLNELDKDPAFPAPGCIDTTMKPPVYGYGSRKYLRGKEINLFTRGQGVAKTRTRASGIDCSEFISAAFAAEGLKFKSSDKKFKSFTTRSLHDISDDKNSCVKPTEFELPYSIQSGDVINLAGNHVVMVDSVGRDPLGIKKYSKNNNCNALTIEDFNFTYIHSGALNNYGPARVEAKIHAKKRSTMFSNLMIEARKSCHDIVAGKEKSHVIRQDRFSVLRHDSVNPDCHYSKKGKLKGQSCVEQCLAERERDVY